MNSTVSGSIFLGSSNLTIWNSHVAKTLQAELQLKAESFADQNESTSKSSSDVSSAAEVAPEMLVTEFYEWEIMSSNEYQPSSKRARQEQTGHPVKMGKFFDSEDEMKPNHVTIVGPAGSGKTTIMRRFVRNKLRVEDEGEHIVVLNGDDYNLDKKKMRGKGNKSTAESSDKKDIDDTARKNKGEEYEDVACGGNNDSEEIDGEISLLEFLLPGSDADDHRLQNGLKKMLASPRRITFVIDSIDTLPFTLEGKHRKISPDDIATPAEFMYNIMVGNIFKGCRILSSSREYAITKYEGQLRADRIICLVGLSEASIKTCITNVLGEDKSKEFSKELERKYPTLWALCSTPVYLSFTLFVYQNKKESDALPTTMSGIIFKLLQILFHSKHGITGSEGKANIIHLLERLSYKGIMAGKVTFNEEDLKDVNLTPAMISSLAMCVPGSKKEDNMEESAKKILEGNCRFLFCHQTLQEALCALHVIKLPTVRFNKFLKEELGKPALSVVRKFICGALLDKEVHDQAIKVKDMDDKQRKDMDDKQISMVGCLKKQLREAQISHRLELYVSLHEGGTGVKDIARSDVNHMDLAGEKFSISEMHAVGSLVNKCGQLQELALADCYITPEVLDSLDNVVKDGDVEIKFFDLKNNRGMKDGIGTLGNVIKKAKVHSVNLDKCRLSPEQVSKLGESLPGFKLETIHMLEDYAPEINAAMMDAICSLLPRVSEDLKLDGWVFKPDEVRKLAHKLQRLKEEDRSSILCIHYGEDGKQKIEAERIEDVYEEVLLRFTKSFIDFARSRRGLKLDEPTISIIHEDSKKGIKEKRICMLEHWKEREGAKGTCSKLRELVEKFFEEDG